MAKVAPPAEGKMPGWSLRPPEWLEGKRQEISASAFEKGFRQRPYAKEDLFFPHFKPGVTYFYGEDWRRISDPTSPDYDPDNPAYIGPEWPRYAGVDRSSKKRRGNVICTIAVSPRGVRHVADIQIGAWSEPELCRILQHSYEANRPRIINVENNALQGAIIDWLDEMRLSCGNVVEPFHTGKQKVDPEIGLPSLDVQFQEERWRISIPHSRYEIITPHPHDGSLCACDICTLVHDFRTFTWSDLDTTPDSLMACWFSKEASRVGEGFSLGSFAVSRINSVQVRQAATAKGFAEAASQVRLPVGVDIFNGRGFGRAGRRSTYDFGRFRSIEEYNLTKRLAEQNG